MWLVRDSCADWLMTLSQALNVATKGNIWLKIPNPAILSILILETQENFLIAHL